MEKPLTMPKLGMTMTEGTVLRWLYQEGDWIEKGEPLVEVMTDKVNMEVEAPFSGRLTHIMAKDGDILSIGATLATLVDDSVEPPLTASTGTIVMSTTGRNAIASTPAAKREAAIRNVELQSIVQSGITLPLNRSDVLAFVQQLQDKSSSTEMTRQAQTSVRATPVAQKIAREHQVDLATVAERKQGEKVTRADVEAHLEAVSARTPTTKDTPPVYKIDSTTSQADVESELIPLTPVRRLIGKRMLESVTSAPHIYLDLEVDMTEAERCREHLGRSLKEQGEQVPSVTALLVQAVAAALVKHPEVNAALDPGSLQGKDAIRRWKAVHIGIAVDTEQALLTPVIRNAHQLSLVELARELRRLAQAARQSTLKPEELAGATFTISNLGMYGIDTFHAIIPPGQSAILAVGKVTKRGIVVEDGGNARLEIHPMMKISLSADHRVLDGASGSRFLHRLKTYLEDPYLLL